MLKVKHILLYFLFFSNSYLFNYFFGHECATDALSVLRNLFHILFSAPNQIYGIPLYLGE